MSCCAVTGQGAGVAAALSVRADRALDDVDISAVQAELIRQDVRITLTAFGPVRARGSPRSSWSARRSGSPGCPRPAGSAASSVLSMVPALSIASARTGRATALQEEVLALVAVEELLPEPRRRRVRTVLVDRLEVVAAHQRIVRHEHLPGRDLLGLGRRSGSPSR